MASLVWLVGLSFSWFGFYVVWTAIRLDLLQTIFVAMVGAGVGFAASAYRNRKARQSRFE